MDSFPDAACHASTVDDARSRGGLLFNLERDMSEVLPLSNTSYEYRRWAPLLWSMADDYAKATTAGASQMHRGQNNDRFPCCNKCTPMPTCCKCGTTALRSRLSESSRRAGCRDRSAHRLLRDGTFLFLSF